MDLVPVYADASQAATQPLPSGTVPVDAGQQRMIGLTLSRVERRATSGTLRTLGRVTIDENRIFPVRTGCEGSVTRVFPGAATGKRVRRGEPLATVYGRDFTTAQRSFLYALRASENPPPALPGEDPGQPILSLQEARLVLRNLGMGDAQIDELARTRQVMLEIQLVAPASGVILDRSVAREQRFDKDVELFRIADLSRVWIVADVLGDDQGSVRAGDTARVSLPGGVAAALTAKVSGALPRFDGASRALKVRLDAENPNLVLRPDMFVDLEFAVTLPETTTVPAEAVVESGTGAIVYVAAGAGTYAPRSVQTGWRFAGRIQILRGLNEGESIVVSGNTLLDSESRMRRGDAGVHD
jgi:Cu(I)/Ag(I) efflux system membrane fusion protein